MIIFHLIAGRRAALAAVLVAATQAPALTAAGPGPEVSNPATAKI